MPNNCLNLNIYPSQSNLTCLKEWEKKIPVALNEVIIEGDITKNIPLKPWDIINVPLSFFKQSEENEETAELIPWLADTLFLVLLGVFTVKYRKQEHLVR